MKYNRNPPLHQTEVVTTTTRPYKAKMNTDIMGAVLRQSLVLGFVGCGASIYIMLVRTEIPLDWAIAPPVFGFSLPWLKQFVADFAQQHRAGNISANEARIILAQQQQALYQLVGDMDGDGDVDDDDVLIQMQREESLAEFVRQVFLLHQSGARHAWDHVGYDEWSRLIDVCVKAGLFTTSVDKAGKRHTRKVKNITYVAALMALKDNGEFLITPTSDLIPQAGTNVKDEKNAVASSSYDGPVTTLED